MHHHPDRPFERHFGRVAHSPNAGTRQLDASIDRRVCRRVLDPPVQGDAQSRLRDDFSRAVDALRLSLMTLSRLTVRMTPDQAADALRRATEMAKDPQLADFRLIEALGELAKYAANAVPTTQQGALALVCS